MSHQRSTKSATRTYGISAAGPRHHDILLPSAAPVPDRDRGPGPGPVPVPVLVPVPLREGKGKGGWLVTFYRFLWREGGRESRRRPRMTPPLVLALAALSADGCKEDLHRRLTSCVLANSQSQLGEELVVLPTLLRATRGRTGVFVEIGAFKGIALSNTLALEK